MKVQIHQHTSRYSRCAVNGPGEMMSALVINGYDAVFITDHNTMWPDDELDALRAQFPELLILPGAELTRRLPTGDSADLLLLGTNDTRYLEMATFPEIIEAAREDGLLTAAAHPFRAPGHDAILASGLCPDALEYGCPHHDADDLARVDEIAGLTGMKRVNASDVHFAPQCSRFWIETHAPFATGPEFRDLVLRDVYRNGAEEDAAPVF